MYETLAFWSASWVSLLSNWANWGWGLALFSTLLTAGISYVVARRQIAQQIKLTELEVQARYEKAIALAQQKYSVKAEQLDNARREFRALQLQLAEHKTRSQQLDLVRGRYKETLRRLPEYQRKIQLLDHKISEKNQALRQETERRAQAEANVKHADEVQEQLRHRENEVRHLTAGAVKLRNRLTEMTERLQSQQREAQQAGEFLNKAQGLMQLEFKQLAENILQEKADKFSAENKSALDLLLSPLKDQLGSFRKKLEDTYEKDTRERASLKTELGQLKTLNQRLSEEASNLVNALKGEQKTQGKWGELILERVLENSGLVLGREYEREVVAKDKRGRTLRPDVVVHLPGGRDIVIDAKVSLTAYERAMSSSQDAERRKHLNAHVQSIRSHVQKLSEKAYEDLPKVNSLDFVLLFIPIEGAFHAALEESVDLYSEAYEKNIVLVSPTTLLVTCRTIQNIWRYEKQSKHAEEIARQAGDMLDKFVGFVSELENVGYQLEKAQESYSTAHKRLTSGRGNLVNRAKSIQKLGVRNKKALPEDDTMALVELPEEA